jgi:hypothetical protein
MTGPLPSQGNNDETDQSLAPDHDADRRRIPLPLAQRLFGMNEQLNPCQCCGQRTISEPNGYEICEICGWEDDFVQNRDPTYAGGANQMSLEEARTHWRGTGQRVTCGNGSDEMNAIQKQAREQLGTQQ